MKVSVTFLASGRTDIEVGSGIVDTLYLVGCGSTGQQTASVATSTNWNNRKGVVAKVFLSGFEILSAGRGVVDIRISNPTVNANNIGFTISSQSQVGVAYVSYVVYDQNAKGADNYPPIERSPVSAAAQTPINSGFRYTFFGLSGFNLNNNLNPSFSVFYAPGSLTIGSQSTLNFVSVNYVQIGVQTAGRNCNNCQGYPYTSQGSCVATCPAPSVVSGSVCVVCGPNSQPDGKGACVCANSYFLIAGACGLCPIGQQYNSTSQSCYVPCPANSQPDSNGNCVCVSPYLRIQGVCGVCPVNQQYNLTSQSCYVPCPANSQPDTNGNCVCVAPYLRIQGVCGICPTNQQYNVTSQSCYVPCPANSQPDGNRNCVCIPSFFLISGACAQCPIGMQYNITSQSCYTPCPANSQADNSGRCVCLSSYYLIGGACAQCAAGAVYNSATQTCQTPTCPQNSAYDQASGQCLCIAGTSLVGGQCITMQQPNPSTNCPVNSYYNGTDCACAPGLNMINGFCATCPYGYTYNSGACQLTQNNFCPANSAYDPSVLKCVCVTNYVVINGACGQCPAGTRYDGNNCVTPAAGGGIICPTGGNCLQFCANYPNTVYDSASFSCVCMSGTYNLTGTCQSCPAGQAYSNGACTSGKAPSCASGTYFDDMEKKCLNCPDGCDSCTNCTECITCGSGWFKNTNSLCTEVCGDSRRFLLECDDGNSASGDGCSSTCRIEKGFTCQGGSPTSKDVCTNTKPTRIILTPTGQTREFGKITANVRVNFLPTNLTLQNCNVCNNILLVNVTSGTNTPSITARYIPGTTYTFSVVFNFGREPIADYTASVQINPALANYFPGQDISQVAALKLVPSQMAIIAEVGTLALSESD